MTVALGLVCNDGVIVAADSQGTGEGVAARSEKVKTFGRCPVIWTAAGSVFVMEEVQSVFDSEDAAGTPDAPKASYTEPNPEAIRASLGKPMHRRMSEAYGRMIGTGPPPGYAHAFSTSFLILGYANDTPWFLEFAADGQVNWHTRRGFYAVGSGGAFATVAHALMAHYADRELTLSEGKMLAYRTIETTIEVSPGGVGPPVQIAVCDNDGARVLTADEVDAISGEVAAWKTLERETLFKSPTERAQDAEGDLPELP